MLIPAKLALPVMAGKREKLSHMTKVKKSIIQKNNSKVDFELFLEMAAKLHWIKESFKKYEIEDLGCQLYIACEAGKIKDSKKKVGRMTTMIHSLIS